MDGDLEKKLTEVQDWLKREFAAIRTGQASPGLLDSVRVESYGTAMPLNQLSNVGVEDARTLRISPWDAGTIGAIETAIREADLGVSVATDSSGLRVVFPELTAERREQLVKLAKAKLEEARVSVRSLRDDAIKDLERQHKAGELSEDDKFAEKDSIQRSIDSANKTLEQLFSEKDSALRA